MAADRPAAPRPFDAACFVREARAETRARVPRTDRFVDGYVLVLAVLTVGAWIYGLSSGLGAQLGALVGASGQGGLLERDAAAWLGPGAPLLGAAVLLVLTWAGLVRALLVLGPVGIPPDRAFWLWRLPAAEHSEPGRALGRAALGAGGAAALAGACASVVVEWADVLPAGGPGGRPAAFAVCLGALGVTAVGAAARLQAARSTADGAAWQGQLSAAVAVAVLGTPAAWAPAVLVLPPAAGLALAGLATAVAAGAVVVGSSAARSLTGADLRRAGARTRYLTNAVRLLSADDLRQSLAGTDQSAVRRPSAAIPSWVSGPRRVVLFAALVAEARTPWRSRAAADLGVLALVLVAFPGAVVVAAWAGLLVVAYRGLGRGIGYVVAARGGSAAERQLPLSGAAAAAVRLVVPCALNALVLGATALLAGLAVQGPAWPHLAVGLVAGCGIGAAAVHRVLGPEPDLTRPPIDSPMGPIPHAQVAAYGRGLLLVLLLATGPAVVVVLPHLWPAVLGALAALALLAAGLAAAADGRS